MGEGGFPLPIARPLRPSRIGILFSTARRDHVLVDPRDLSVPDFVRDYWLRRKLEQRERDLT